MKHEAAAPLYEAAGPFTAFPNALLDRVMPALRDTEWRLLCVIVRQTLGWSENGKRKSRDWLTQSQLMARTGRNSAALSAALDVLVRRRLIGAWDEAGRSLLTPQARRARQGRVYYGLGEAVLQGILQGDAKVAKTALRKANTIEENRDEREVSIKKQKSYRLYSGWARAGQVAEGRYCTSRMSGDTFSPSDE